jgi:hypothetical protein
VEAGVKSILLLAAVSGTLMAQTPSVESIMSQVAINQAKSQELRTNFVYNQKQLLRMLRPNGKLAREERREYTVLPAFRGIKKDLLKFEGKFEQHGAYINYYHPGYQYKELDIDGGIIGDLSNSLTNDKNSRDGIASDLFPLTYHQQLKYSFRLIGTEQYQGRQVYRVAFEPRKTPHLADSDDSGHTIWKGEALIDAAELQPVVVYSKMALRIPAAVKILLGTDIRGLGFTLSYQKFADGVWFPVSYGGEFEVKGLFFYRRTMTISLVNSDFRRLDVSSHIAYAKDTQ